MLNDIYHAIDPIAFWIGPFAVRWYGLGYILGILLGGLLLMRVCKRWRIRFSADALLTLLIAAILGIILGARFGYILFYGAGYYFENPAAIFDINGGLSGMSFHGGVIGMVIAMFIASRILKMPFASLGDLVVIVAPIGIFLVRCANFINGELWGAPTDVPWGVEFESGGGIARHPSQLYEAMLEGLVLFIVMMILAWRKRPLYRGGYIGIFMILYGVFRISIEFVREPDVQLGYLAGGWLTMGMVLCLPMIVAGIIMLIYAAKTKNLQKGLPEPETVRQSSRESGDTGTFEDAEGESIGDTDQVRAEASKRSERSEQQKQSMQKEQSEQQKQSGETEQSRQARQRSQGDKPRRSEKTNKKAEQSDQPEQPEQPEQLEQPGQRDAASQPKTKGKED